MPGQHPGGRVHDLAEGVSGADVVICLRMQLERQDQNFVPSLQEYTNEFIVTEELLAKYAPNAVVMHPGPINRGTEVQSALIDGPRSLVSRQVTNGVAVRMAVLLNVSVGLRELVEDFGGGTASGRPVKAIQVGGPLGSYVAPEN